MQPIEGEKTYALGLIEHDEELSKTQLTAERVYAAVQSRDLPPKLDLRLDCFPVRNQGNQGACVAFATMEIAQNLEYYDTSELRQPLSPQYLYNLRSNYPSEGMNISDAMKIVQKDGVVLEKEFPYGTEGGKDSVPVSVIDIGKEYKMGTFAWIETLEGLKKSMHSRKAGVLLTFKVYNFTKDFWQKRNGDTLQGYHAVAAVGYDDENKEIIIQNSWGKDWGNKGYTAMSYDDFHNHAYNKAIAFVDVSGSRPFSETEPGHPNVNKCPISCGII